MKFGASLDDLKRRLIDDVDAAAAARRARHLTPAGGMDAVYRQNVADAQFYVAHAGQLGAPEVPALAAVASAFGLTLYQAAQLVLFKDGESAAAISRIEVVRLPAKAAIAAANTAAEARAAAEVDWSGID